MNGSEQKLEGKVWETIAPSDHVFTTTRPRIVSNRNLMLYSYYQSLTNQDVWDEVALRKRAEITLPLALQLWQCPA